MCVGASKTDTMSLQTVYFCKITHNSLFVHHEHHLMALIRPDVGARLINLALLPPSHLCSCMT